MISKYFLWTSVLIVNLLLFSSCLNSSDNDIELPTDPQIYAISIVSKTDTTGLLPALTFTIDQVNKKIFNKKPLPYLFRADSAFITITGSSGYFPHSRIDLTLEPDSVYTWNRSDSIPLPRLRKIKTTAPDGVTAIEYNFQLNIYQQDPYIIDWTKMEIEGNYLTPPVESQRTIAFRSRFYTYYRSGTEMKAVSAAASQAPVWGAVALSGVPHTLRLSSLLTTKERLYALDGTSGSLYQSSDATNWRPVTTEAGYEVVALYSALPATASGNILLAVRHNGTVQFAHTDDFSKINLMTPLPEGMPVAGFSAMKVEQSLARQFIFLSGGTTTNNAPNRDIWILQEDEGRMTHIRSRKPAEAALEGSTLFYYDDKPYLLATTDGKSRLLYSETNGTDWTEAGENQAFPSDFTQRSHASVITDADNYIWIFGGISSSNAQFTEIWQGRLNRFIPN